MVCLLFCVSLHMSTIECHELQKKKKYMKFRKKNISVGARSRAANWWLSSRHHSDEDSSMLGIPFPLTHLLCHTFRRTIAAMASETAVSRQAMRLLQAALVHVYAKYANFTYSQ